MHCDIQVLRHTRGKGPAAARNTGLAACSTDFVAFLDSDVVPRRGWLEALLGHFCDPAVALVAPRIVGLRQADNLVARYEAVRSSLDLGLREAPVVPYGTVSYVPSAAIICRRSRGHRNWAGSMRHSSPARTSTCAGASSRPAPGCATNPSRWSLTTTAHRCENGSRASLSTANRRPRSRCAIPARRRRW